MLERLFGHKQKNDQQQQQPTPTQEELLELTMDLLELNELLLVQSNLIDGMS